VLRAVEGWFDPAEWVLVEFERLIDGGDRLVSIHKARAKARHIGIEIDTPLVYLWTLKDGKVVHFRAFVDLARASPRSRRATGVGCRRLNRLLLSSPKRKLPDVAARLLRLVHSRSQPSGGESAAFTRIQKCDRQPTTHGLADLVRRAGDGAVSNSIRK
jgi:hypothetical protein